MAHHMLGDKPAITLSALSVGSRRQHFKRGLMKMWRVLVVLMGLLLPAATAAAGGIPSGNPYVYVAPNVIQSRAHGIFSTLALTNTTEYWFNPRIYLVNADGEVVKEFAPLLKAFATWQKSSVDFLPDDFNGSVWIVSSQPIVASSFMHQIRQDGSLSLLGNTELKGLETVAAESAVQALTTGR